MPETKPSHRTARTWEKIVVETDSRMTDAVGAYLSDLSGTGVEISAAGNREDNKEEPAVFEKVFAYILLDSPESDTKEISELVDDIRNFLARLSPLFPDCPEPKLSTERLEEEDWSRIWKSFFSTFQITPTLTIKPSWEETGSRAETKDRNHHVIEMDPGMAFGTGHHASTRLALLLLEQLFQDGEGSLLKKILDVGTGSGILAMGCGLFGAEHVLAIDNDPDAVAAAAANVKRNRLSDKITVSDKDVTTIQSDFDLIVANITHDILSELADTLTDRIAPGGYLVLSGILKEGQEDSIRRVYTGKGLNFIKSIMQDEWAALLFQKI
jgi:ribosomal protein L11 methyltransferase